MAEPDCTNPAKARGLCEKHYVRAWRHGTLPPKKPPRKGCSIAGCDGPHFARGWCEKHYFRNYKRGSTELTEPQRTMTIEDRFWFKVDKSAGPEGDWLWTAGRTGQGYGQFYADGQKFLAHRFAYELCIGPVSEYLQVDHVRTRGCRSRLCVNPAHLEAVTLAENLRRAPAGKRAQNGEKVRAALARTAEPRFWAKADRSDGPDVCWPWLAYTDGNDNAKVWWQRSTHAAREVAWLLSRGSVPSEHTVVQECGRNDCVNPAHLKTVPSRQVVADHMAAMRAIRTRQS